VAKRQQKPTRRQRHLRIISEWLIDDIRDRCALRAREDHQPLMADAIDTLKHELVPVWERSGWWTSNPSAEVRHMDLYRLAEQDATKYSRRRNRQVTHRSSSNDPLTQLAKDLARQAATMLEQVADDLPDVERQGDHCLMRVDQLIADLDD
jgi:hypothetical protein